MPPYRPLPLASLLLGLATLSACTDRPTDDAGLDEPDASTGPATPMEPADDGSTGDVSATSAGLDDTTASDETEGLDDTTEGSTGNDLPELCEPYLDLNQSDTQRCGLTHVNFEWRSGSLNLASKCQLAAAAPCIASRGLPLYLEAHTSSGEGDDAPPMQAQEFMIQLADDRGETVRRYLENWGDVPPEQLAVIVKGGLEASDPDLPEERRVEFVWAR
ncbi:MAG: hypothetical protein AAF799_30995 [Myxococcota bacterium]